VSLVGLLLTDDQVLGRKVYQGAAWNAPGPAKLDVGQFPAVHQLVQLGYADAEKLGGDRNFQQAIVNQSGVFWRICDFDHLPSSHAKYRFAVGRLDRSELTVSRTVPYRRIKYLFLFYGKPNESQPRPL